MVREQIFRKILVPVDGSVPSLFAQELTAFMAKKLGSRVTVLHVVTHHLGGSVQEPCKMEDRHEHVPMGMAGGNFPATIHVPESPAFQVPDSVASEIVNWYHQKGEQAIADAVALFEKEGIPVDQKLLEHVDPASSILKEAAEGKYDLIAMGNSEEEEEEAHLGSIAGKVLRHAHVPVLIARKKGRLSKMLIPVDGSKTAHDALENAAILAKETGATMTLLYVQESGLSKLKPDVAKDIGNRVLSSAAELVKGMKVGRKMEAGDPGKKIIQMAEEGDYDLVVMGSRGLGALERFLLGSVSDHVVHYSNHSVLIMK